ncbi:MAG: shikimate kinase [Leptospira sp.]|nr:shikimate kinase [Leptospira sp.]
MKKNLALIGPRGVGKSKIAKRISKLTERPIVSTDSIAVYELGGISIADFVASQNGNWRPFRDMEFSILEKLKNAEGIILDCGGGILFDLDESTGKEILSIRKLSILREIAEIVFLDNDKEKLVKKVLGDSTRPDLSKQDSYASILERRLPFYKDSADFRLYLGDMKKEEAAKRIVDLTHFYN